MDHVPLTPQHVATKRLVVTADKWFPTVAALSHVKREPESHARSLVWKRLPAIRPNVGLNDRLRSWRARPLREASCG